jgi:hypothetical protein
VDFMGFADAVATAGFGAGAGFAGALAWTVIFGVGFAIAFTGTAAFGFGEADLLAGAGLAAGDFFVITDFSAVFLRGAVLATALTGVAFTGAVLAFAADAFTGAAFFGAALAADTLAGLALAGDAGFFAGAALAGADLLAGAGFFAGALAATFTAAGLAVGFLALLDTGVLADFLAAVATIDSSVVKTAREKLAADYAMFTPCKGPVDYSGRCRP